LASSAFAASASSYHFASIAPPQQHRLPTPVGWQRPNPHRPASLTPPQGPTIGLCFFGAFFMRVLFALLTSLAIAPTALAQAKPVTTASGLVFESIKEGTGESPKATDTVKVHYKGTLAGWQGVRQLLQARRAHRVSAEPRDPLLDRRRAAHEARRQGQADLPTWHCLWRAWRGWCDSAQRHAEFRGGAGLGAPLSIGNARVAAGLRGRTLQRSGNGLAAQGVRHLPAPSDRRP
jgi:hypothetical protein